MSKEALKKEDPKISLAATRISNIFDHISHTYIVINVFESDGLLYIFSKSSGYWYRCDIVRKDFLGKIFSQAIDTINYNLNYEISQAINSGIIGKDLLDLLIRKSIENGSQSELKSRLVISNEVYNSSDAWVMSIRATTDTSNCGAFFTHGLWYRDPNEPKLGNIMRKCMSVFANRFAKNMALFSDRESGLFQSILDLCDKEGLLSYNRTNSIRNMSSGNQIYGGAISIPNRALFDLQDVSRSY